LERCVYVTPQYPEERAAQFFRESQPAGVITCWRLKGAIIPFPSENLGKARQIAKVSQNERSRIDLKDTHVFVVAICILQVIV
jgi:hypothetical protein